MCWGVEGAQVKAWQEEIEARLGEPVRVVEYPGGSVEGVAVEGPGAMYLRNAAFVQALEGARALTLNLRSGEQQMPYVFVNRRNMPTEEAAANLIVAHELGHIWLQAQGYFPPRFGQGRNACVAIHVGDIVQHHLMRREMDRRGIAWREITAREYEAAWRQSQGGSQAAGDVCLRARRLSLMVDLRAGFAGEEAEWWRGYLKLLGEQDPEAEARAIELAERWGGDWELTPENYQRALAEVTDAMGAVLSLD